jgi:hypothetical protein
MTVISFDGVESGVEENLHSGIEVDVQRVGVCLDGGGEVVVEARADLHSDDDLPWWPQGDRGAEIIDPEWVAAWTAARVRDKRGKRKSRNERCL